MFLTLLANLLKLEIIPFFVFKMYSNILPRTEEVSFYVLEYNNKEFNIPEIWNHHKRMLFYYTIEHHQYIYRNNGYDRFQLKLIPYLSKIEFFKKNSLYPFKYQNHKNYAKWLKTYLEDLTQEKIRYLKIYKVVAIYEKCILRVKNKEQIINYANN
jgi:hypothetical protein